MKLRRSLTLVIFASTLIFAACTQKSTTNTSTAGAISSNSVTSAAAIRMFDRRNLAVSGFNNLNEFIRSDVRQRLDREPVGDTDEGYAPPAETENSTEALPAENDPQNTANDEDTPAKSAELEKVKFSWAKKKFGDAIGAVPTSNGVIVLYADENYYDVGRMIRFVEEGRDRIAANSGIAPGRIQVVFGGYRGVAQVEFWIVPFGEQLPTLKPEDRDGSGGSEN